MRIFFKLTLLFIGVLILQGCSNVKVLHTWKGEPSNIEKFKSKNILVIARTANDHTRIAFEEKIANALKAKGIKATESFKKAPKIYPNREISEQRMKLIKSLINSEDFTAVVLTVIKDKKETTSTSRNGIYVGATYSGYYPGYYGTFYDYFAYPYANGYYYDSFGGYIPTSTTTNTYTTYALETLAYNLDESDENQLVAVITSSIKDPKEAYKTAEKYVDQIIKSLE